MHGVFQKKMLIPAPKLLFINKLLYKPLNVIIGKCYQPFDVITFQMSDTRLWSVYVNLEKSYKTIFSRVAR